MHFKKILNDTHKKTNKIWVDQVSEFYSNSFKDFLKVNNTEMHTMKENLLLLRDLLEH